MHVHLTSIWQVVMDKNLTNPNGNYRLPWLDNLMDQNQKIKKAKCVVEFAQKFQGFFIFWPISLLYNIV